MYQWRSYGLGLFIRQHISAVKSLVVISVLLRALDEAEKLL
jgi:hypothetical protein